MRVNGLDGDREPLLVATIGLGRELDERVKGDLDVWQLVLRESLEEGVEAANDGLVADDKDVILSLKLHDNGLETDDDVSVRFAAAVSVVELQE